MKRVLLFVERKRVSLLRTRPVEEGEREVPATAMNVHYTVYGKEGAKEAEGVEEGVLELELRGTVRLSLGLTETITFVVEAEEGRVERRGNLLVVR